MLSVCVCPTFSIYQKTNNFEQVVFTFLGLWTLVLTHLWNFMFGLKSTKILTICRLSISPLGLLRKHKHFFISPASNCRWINYKIGLWSNQTSSQELSSIFIEFPYQPTPHRSQPDMKYEPKPGKKWKKGCCGKNYGLFWKVIFWRLCLIPAETEWVHLSVPGFAPSLVTQNTLTRTQTGKTL